MRYWKRIVILLILLALGFALGWFMTGGEKQVSPVQKDEPATSVVARPRFGYCCMTGGNACERMDAAADCFVKRGKVFNTDQTLCDEYCYASKP